MEAKEKVLATMKAAGEPMNAGKIAELSGLDRKEVDKAMKQLKEEGAIVSPVRRHLHSLFLYILFYTRFNTPSSIQ